MLRSTCICQDNKTTKFKSIIEYTNESVFKDFEGTVIGKCSRCGVFKTFPPKTTSFNPQQSKIGFYEQNRDLFVELFLPIVNKIKRFRKSGKVLDVGCSSGILLELLKQEGFDVYGTEPNTAAYKLARSKLGNRIKNGTLHDYVKLDNNKFDVVIYNHVLEHISNPSDELAMVKKIMKKDGILVIGVPNTQNIIYLIRRKYWEYLVPNEHVWHFSKHNLSKLLNRKGFLTLDVSYSNDARKEYPMLKRLYFQLLSLCNQVLRTGEAMLLITRFQ